MKTSGGQQIEFDVFPRGGKDDYSYLSDIKKDASSPESLTVALPQQSVIILVLCVVMLLVVSFALGVERGKLIARNSVPPAPAAWEKPAAPAAETEIRVSSTQPVKEIQEPAAAAAPQAPAPPAQQEGPAAGNYVIQVASLKTEEAAARLAQTLSKEGWPSFTKASGDYVVVLAGSFSKKEEAQNRIGELKKTYTDCFIKQI
ncbi:MAG: SPOR domain-containing protein [Deltaproteobacteria bacterium]